MRLKGSETEKNLLKAFSGESQARNRYTYWASQAKKEGFEQIAAIFLDTADNEKEHAKKEFKFLEGGEVEIQASFPAGVIGATLENLKEAAAGEHYEWTEMYPGFAKIARGEGHEERYLILAKNIEQCKVFKREKSVKWRCRNCGYIHEGLTPPEKCPACAHPTAYYEIKAENF